jgi:hypothetical protein
VQKRADARAGGQAGVERELAFGFGAFGFGAFGFGGFGFGALASARWLRRVGFGALASARWLR